ncbi:competence/damage-inducible protein A [Sutcliffiella rhizosphaerae]|uniref:Putative competence-damage inducible protein n=1 Tax=Sutcliffiella rhizosphaerae TaxID=2880967 RepID=A0ABN8A3B9_9BACI|nr:competence/damage-inducible protein A [Sutcliffiella rhizosphaerae]CAG9619644.1 Putative competence-damage inducible protein [Sutcliffiella rhizosphaerae]
MTWKSEIIAVGSELLLGQICNTNAQFLSKQLAEIGIDVYFHTVVGDNPIRLQEAITNAKKRSNLLILTGGLGPTKDDLTKETIATMLDKNLIMDNDALANIEAYFQKTNRIMSENNKKQALVLEGSTILANDYGMAPGMALTEAGFTYLLLPGPPKELQPMFNHYGREFLLDKLGVKEQIVSRVLRFFGIGESQLETDILDLIESQTNPTIAPLAGDNEVTLRLTAKHHSIDKANHLINVVEEQILNRVGEFFYGYEEDTIFSVVFEKVQQSKYTLSSAESLTGGLFSERLTSFPGASEVIEGAVVSYTNDVKENVLGVSKQTLDTDGAVSSKCALEMAEGVKRLLKTDIGISFTGVAGPGTMDNQPVGTVYIGIALPDRETIVHKIQLVGTRDGIKQRSAKYGCHFLLKELFKK